MIRSRSARVLWASLVALAGALLSHSAQAQVVGYPPERSPFRDLEYKQEVSLFTGYFHAGKDAAGVAPRSAPMIGARYEVRVGGPAQFTVRVARVGSERQIIDPAKHQGQRDVGGLQSWPLWSGDLSLTLNLTGQKSYHQLVPLLNAGAGIFSDFKSKADTGGFKFGTTFAFAYGAGVRWVPGGRWQARVDLTDYAYQINYPETYYLGSSSDTTFRPVLKSSQATRAWKQNLALTIGGSYLFFR